MTKKDKVLGLALQTFDSTNLCSCHQSPIPYHGEEKPMTTYRRPLEILG